MPKSKTDQILRRVYLIALSFQTGFTTEQLVERLSERFPVTWRYLTREYAPAGKGAGHPYSAASRISQMLRLLAHQGHITRDKYVPASPSWGSPVVRTWHS